MKTGLESLDTGASNITYSGNEGPKSPQQIAEADYMLLEEYQKYVFEMEEMGLEPMSFEQFRQEAMSGMAMGGRAGFRVGGVSGREYGSSKSKGSAAPGGISGSTNQGGGDDRREQVSVARTQGRDAPTDSQIREAQKETDTINQRIASSALGKQQAKNQFINMKSTPKKTGLATVDAGIRLLNAILPSKRTKEFYYDNVRGRTVTLPDGTTITFDEDNYDEYDRLRKAGVIGAYGNVEMGQNAINTRGGGGQQQIAGIPSMAPTTTAMATTPTADDFVFNFAQPGRQLTEEDLERVAAIRAADGGRIGYAGGGIADLRQGYFLGKLVKKAARGIKKIIKSPIGRTALMAAPFFFPQVRAMIPGGVTAAGDENKTGFMANLFNKLLRQKDDDLYSSFDPFKIGILGASALTGLMAKQDEDDEVSLDEYMRTASRGPDIDPRGIREYIAANKGNINPIDYAFLNPAYYQTAADGGRIGLAEGLTPRQAALKALPEYKTFNEDEEQKLSLGGSAGLPPITQQTEGMYSQSFPDDETPMPTQPDQMPRPKPMMNPMMGRQDLMMARQMNPMMGRGMPMMGGRMMAQEGGLMDMGGMEKDYRNEGGFVAIGGQERADDVPARLSKNEFVFTADAVRNAGGGDIDKGAEIMENMMENLEAGGKVSEESQGLEGARAMFATQQRLGEVL